MRWRLNPSSLRLQLVLGIGLLALLFALLLGALVSHLSQRHLENDHGSLLKVVASRMAAQLAQDMNGRADELLLLASLDTLRDPATPVAAQQALIQRVHQAYPFYAWIGFTDAQGRIAVSSEPALAGADVAQRDWFLKGREGLHFGDAHEAKLLAHLLPPPSTGLPLRMVDISTPVLDDQGRLRGVLAAHLSLDWAQDARARLLDQLPGERFDLLVLSGQHEVLLGAPGLQLSQAEAQALIAQARSAKATAPSLTWPDGGRYLSSAVPDSGFRRYPGLGWTVLVREPQTLVYAEAEQLSRLVAFVALLGTALFAGLLWLVVGRRLRPLERLSEAAQALRLDGPKGHLPATLPVPEGDGEVAVFARSLTTLVNALGQSQARFRKLFDDAPVAMVLVDHQGLVAARNAAFDALLGYPHDTLRRLGDWWRLCFDDPDYCTQVRNTWRAAMADADGQTVHFADGEYRILRHDRSVCWLQISGIQLPDGMLCSFHDLTPLRQTEDQLRLWAESFELAQVGLMIADARHNTVLAVNPAYAQERGHATEAMIGMPWRALFPPDRHGDLDAMLAALGRSNHGVFESEHLRRDGSRFPVLLDITVLRDTHGAPLRRVTYALDLSERKRAEAEVMQLNATLEKRVAERTAELSAANRELDSFAYSVSHDLRAPLRIMNGFAQVLQNEHGEQLAPEAQIYLDRILQSSLKMGALIEGILTLSRSARGELHRDPVNLSELARRRLAELALNEPDRCVEIEVEDGLNTIGDARMLDAVMFNLIDNAWKYTGKTEAPRIRVHRGAVNGVNGFCVSDNGSGFDMDKAQRLFQPFQRLHRADEFPGTGVGLATVQRIIERHGGCMAAQAAPGQGASFCFSLPGTA